MKLIKDFQRAPYRFMYESDLQAMLFAQIRELMPDSLKIKGTGQPLTQYEVSIVHTEYMKRIDVACLNVERAINQKPRIHKGADIHVYELPVLVGVEIKYRKLGDRFGLEACLSDFTKLVSLQIEYPLVLGFIQNDRDTSHFFSAITPAYTAVEVCLTKPLGKINIISPTKRWEITIGS